VSKCLPVLSVSRQLVVTIEQTVNTNKKFIKVIYTKMWISK
jgi:hypothetical protein